MQLHDIVKCDGCYFSNDGLFLVYTVGNKIFLTEVDIFEISRIYVCSHKIDSIEFSCDNIHFSALMKSKGCLCVYSLYKSKLVTRIQDFFQMYVHSFFVNKGSNICVHKYEKKCISIYNINNAEDSLINVENVKFKRKGYCFNDDNNILACVTESNKKIYIRLISLLNYTFINAIECINFYPNNILFTKTSNIIAYSNKNKSLHMYRTDGELLSVHGYSSGLACVNVVEKCDDKNVISIGMEDGAVIILSQENLKEVKKIVLDDIITVGEKPKIYKENTPSKDLRNCVISSNITSRMTGKGDFAFYSNISEGINGEYKLRSEKEKNNNYLKNNILGEMTKIGITLLRFSLCGKYFSVINERHNNVVRIFEAESYTCIAVLQQKGRITSIRWDNVLYKARLLICTASPFLFVWSPDGCEIFEMPCGFACNEATWNSLGTSLLVKNQPCFTTKGNLGKGAFIPP
ncbi:WD repeat-containing protein WRAP73, putative [Plasmodium ovale]|uniref:WD repeat-containing protein WRAP73, putative n=1 Tax=Plasmodium ovale TaxID=36330 RepID=A0A1D3THE1_PLAOA|nr:WD repeat-containing protein WRAP73, putative [Plasmodium ovale]